jgi:hypothetical protein
MPFLKTLRARLHWIWDRYRHYTAIKNALQSLGWWTPMATAVTAVAAGIWSWAVGAPAWAILLIFIGTALLILAIFWRTIQVR